MQPWALRRELEKEKSPSPTRRMRSVEEKQMGGDGVFAPLVGLRKEHGDLGFAAGAFEYGLWLETFVFDLFALPIARG